MKILILGSSGMIGSVLFKTLSRVSHWNVYGTVRCNSSRNHFPSNLSKNLFSGVNLETSDSLMTLFNEIKPDVVINCVGITKHHSDSLDVLKSIPINTLLPHRLANLCMLFSARLIHISTDCVFSGSKGNYDESDIPDATDIYGISKSLGEVKYQNSITLRTSTIGPELGTNYGLLNWFLSQDVECKGFTNAIFSGLPTIVLSEIIRDLIIPNNSLCGLYNIGGKPISKYDLLKLIAIIYEKNIDIIKDDSLVINRSLNSLKFYTATGYTPPDWPVLIGSMFTFR